jgi:hypothetical protein
MIFYIFFLKKGMYNLTNNINMTNLLIKITIIINLYSKSLETMHKKKLF